MLVHKADSHAAHEIAHLQVLLTGLTEAEASLLTSCPTPSKFGIQKVSLGNGERLGSQDRYRLELR